MPELEATIEAPPQTEQEQPKRRGRPPGSRVVDGTVVLPDEGATVAPKRRQRRNTTDGLLDEDDVIALITTIHNIPAKIFSIDELVIEEAQVKPFARDIATAMNNRMPTMAKAAKETVPMLSIASYIGMVEAPTIINTYKAVQQRVANRGAVVTTQPPEAQTGPVRSGEETGSILDRLPH